jgi:hypothetical protein
MVLLKNYSISMDYTRFIIIVINTGRALFDARPMAAKNGDRHRR